jgi:nitroreductase
MLSATLKEILQLAVHAPSGDNSQPWRFEVTGSVVNIYNLPEKDNPVLNYRQRGSYIAHGALVENLVLAAGKLGYAAEVVPFPTPANEAHTARILLKPADVQCSPLVDCILRRHTNRRPYRSFPLSTEQHNALMDCVRDLSSTGELSFALTQQADQKQTLAECASSIEEVILQSKLLHGLLFKDVVWSQAEESKRRSGMFIKTMELAPPQQLAFRMARHWKVMQTLNGVGLSRLIAQQDAKLYATGAGMGVLLVRDSADSREFLLAGRAMQRIWLTATELGLYVQPLAGLLFAAMTLEGGGSDHFSSKHADLIRANNRSIRETLKLGPDRQVAMMFRLGQAAPPSAVCSKKQPQVEYVQA